MSLQELYREVILDHYRNPRHRGTLSGPHVHAEGENPSCGDEFSIDVAMAGDTVVDIATQGQGCSISQASGSMMADAVIGLTTVEVHDLALKFKQMMTIADGENPVDEARPGAALGDLEALQGVRRFPVRIKCADLPWTTLESALARVETGNGGHTP